MRILHAIHDFLPRHRAGSEIYAFELARALALRHDIFIVAAEYDPATPHGTLRWRSHEGLTVIEVVNNWEFDTFEETYGSARLNAQLRHVLEATAPDVLHVHNLLNLSFDLPRLAREQGVAVVATLHDYTLVCPSGGQRVHAAEAHVCATIDAERCSRCFLQSPFAAQMAAGRLTRQRGGRAIARFGAAARRAAPALMDAVAGTLARPSIVPGDITRRLANARHVFDTIDAFVAPSASIADEFVRLGLDRQRVEVSDYGFPIPEAGGAPADAETGRPLRIGFVGTLVWHKGAHVLVEAVSRLSGRFETHIHADPNVFPDYVARLQAAAKTPVAFHGGFDRDRMTSVYGSIDVLVVPSLWPENSPLVIHEAFMHGVAVVAANAGGIPGLVIDGVNGLLYEPFDPGALAAALQRLVDDRTLVRGLASAAPRVKAIAEDAMEWEVRYERLSRSSRQPAGVDA
jgi:glycosyltransferase involved in cell wall biosynthesis